MTDSIAFRARRHKNRAATRTITDNPLIVLPTITNITPSKDTIVGGTTVVVTGTNFVSGTLVTVGNATSPSVTYVNSTTLNVVIPSNYVFGQVPFILTRPDNQASVAANFIYEDPEMLNGLRLSAQSGTPVPTGNETTVSTIYLTQYLHGRIALYNGTYWQVVTTPEVSIALSGLLAGRLYDVFAYVSSGNVILEFGTVWTNDTTRALNLTRLDGVLVSSADSTRRYLGTIKTISTTATTDTILQRFIWNMYNQVERDMVWAETTDSWTYTSTTIRGRGGLATARVEFVNGQNQLFHAEIAVDGQGTSSTGNAGVVGVGLDTTASFSAGSSCVSSFSYASESTYGSTKFLRCTYAGVQTSGYHAAYWNERVVTGSQTITMYGDHGTTAGFGLNSTLRGKIFG
jgi:hypothetical protein